MTYSWTIFRLVDEKEENSVEGDAVAEWSKAYRLSLNGCKTLRMISMD